MFQSLVFVGALAVLLVIIPLAGLGATGSWRQAWRYARDWGRVMLGTIVTAAIVFAVVAELMPHL
jgi:hypothetical protein